VLGFDTEKRPTFVSNEAERLPSIVQLATRTNAYVFQLTQLTAEQCAPLLALLSDEAILKAGVAVDGDVIGLQRRFKDLFQPRGFLRLEELAHSVGFACNFV
jgi:ribonuclease D